MNEFEGLPGAAMVRQGLGDLARGAESAAALTVAIASRRLAELGLDLRSAGALPAEPELDLYALLGQTSPDPYCAYRATVRELDSFIAALELRLRLSR